MKFWGWVREFLPWRLVSLRGGTRDPLTISAINALPISAPPLRQEIVRKKENGSSVASNPEMAEGRTCPVCGSRTKVKTLQYWCDPVTDIITPADTIEQCDCGWTGLLVEHERPF